jgi:hypothetical protein
MDLLKDLDFGVGDDGEGWFLGATRTIAASGAGLVRADIIDIENLILVVVEVRAAVGIFKAIGILRLVLALVDTIEKAVHVVVDFGAAIFVEVAVFIFGFCHTIIFGVGNPITVGVRIVRAAILILEHVVVFGIVWALVIGIKKSVAVLVSWLRHDEASFSAHLWRRLIVCGLSVGLSDVQMGASLGDKALIEFKQGEAEVGFCDGEFAGSAADGAISLCLLSDFFETFDTTA